MKTEDKIAYGILAIGLCVVLPLLIFKASHRSASTAVALQLEPSSPTQHAKPLTPSRLDIDGDGKLSFEELDIAVSGRHLHPYRRFWLWFEAVVAVFSVLVLIVALFRSDGKPISDAFGAFLALNVVIGSPIGYVQVLLILHGPSALDISPVLKGMITGGLIGLVIPLALVFSKNLDVKQARFNAKGQQVSEWKKVGEASSYVHQLAENSKSSGREIMGVLTRHTLIAVVVGSVLGAILGALNELSR